MYLSHTGIDAAQYAAITAGAHPGTNFVFHDVYDVYDVYDLQ
jgi:hypothetical protein